MSEEGKLRLGMMLSYTKMDIDNPMLREWCLVVIRNLTSWSTAIREDLAKLKLIEVDPKGASALKEMGMQDVFDKEINKLKRRDDAGDIQYISLNDETRVGITPWKELRPSAMQPGFDNTNWYITLDAQQRQLLEALVEAQRKQGDMEPLKSEGNFNINMVDF